MEKESPQASRDIAVNGTAQRKGTHSAHESPHVPFPEPARIEQDAEKVHHADEYEYGRTARMRRKPEHDRAYQKIGGVFYQFHNNSDFS